jgi:hypothetical protein
MTPIDLVSERRGIQLPSIAGEGYSVYFPFSSRIEFGQILNAKDRKIDGYEPLLTE